MHGLLSVCVWACIFEFICAKTSSFMAEFQNRSRSHLRPDDKMVVQLVWAITSLVCMDLKTIWHSWSP